MKTNFIHKLISFTITFTLIFALVPFTVSTTANVGGDYTWTVQPVYDELRGLLWPNSNDSIAAKKDGQWGMVDAHGKWTIDPTFDELAHGSSSADLLPAKQGDLWGMIDKDGKWIITPQFEEIWSSFYTDTISIPAKQNGKWGLIDKTGKWTVQPIFWHISGGFYGSYMLAITASMDGEKCGAINSSGEWVIQPMFENMYGSFTDYTLGVVAGDGNGKWGIIDISGKWVMTPQEKYITGGSVSKDIIAISARADNNYDSKVGLIDLNGNWLIEPQFDTLWGSFNENVKAVPAKLERDGQFGFINIKGEWVITPQFDEINSWGHDGAATVKYNGKWGCIYFGDSTNTYNYTPPASDTTDYIYESDASIENITLPTDKLQTVTDQSTAISAINAAVSSLTHAQKASDTGVDLLTLYAEEAIAQSASTTVSSSGIVINQNNVQDLQIQAQQTKTAAEATLASSGIDTARKLNADIKFKTNETKKVTITVDPSAANAAADNVKVETPEYTVAIPQALLQEGTDNSIVITVEEVPEVLGYTSASLNAYAVTAAQPKSYKVTVSREDIDANGVFSFKPASDKDIDYQAVMRVETGKESTAMVSQYDKITGMIKAKIKKSGTYTVKENKKSFTDLTNKSATMKSTIEKLASKGIINGTSSTTFSPDNPITRAELTTLIMRVISKVDDNPKSNFTDVDKAMWYYAPVNSAKKYGIVNGMTETTFAPGNTIQKDQIVAIVARTLRSEVPTYKVNENDKDKYLKNFKDSDKLAAWSFNDIAFAEKAGLIIPKKSGDFVPAELMTRGDAAMILAKLFDKIW